MTLLEAFDKIIKEKGMNYSGFARINGINEKYFLNVLSGMRKVLPVIEDFIQKHKEGAQNG